MIATLSRERVGGFARSPWVRYGVAVVAVAVAVPLKLWLDPLLEANAPFALLVVAVIVAALVGGLGPGLLATGLALAAGNYFFLRPFYEFRIDTLGHFLSLGVFAVEGALISALVAAAAAARRRAEANARRTRESEERFRALVQNASDIVVVLDERGTIAYESPAVQRLLGFAPEERVGLDAFDFLHPDDAGPAREAFDALLGEPGERRSMEYRVRARDGSWRHFEAMATNLLDDPAVGGVVINARDVTERRRAEEDLKESEERHRLLVESVSDYAIFMVDGEGRVTSWNPGAENVFGYREEEIVGERGSILFTPEDRQSGVAERELRRAETEGRAEDERWHLRKDGSRFWASGFVRPVRDEAGSLRGFVKVTRDITERKRANDALRILAQASELLATDLDYRARLTRLAELVVPNLADWCAVDVLEEGGTIERLAVAHEDPEKVALARGLEERYPTDPDAPYGVPNVLRTGEPELVPEIPDELVAALDAERRGILEELGLKSYMVVPMAARGRTLGAITLVSAESGRRYDERDLMLAETLVRRAALAVDNARLYGEAQKEIAERRRAQEELRRSEEEFRAMFELATVGQAQADPATGRFLRINRKMCEITGYAEGELLGMTFPEITHPDDRERDFESFGRMVAGETPDYVSERRYVRKDGTVVWVIANATLVRGAGGEPLHTVASVVDITGRRRAEEALRASEERFRTLADNISQLAWMADENGWIFWYNKRWFEYTGTTLEEMRGWGWRKVHHPDHVDRVIERVQRSWDTGEPWEDTFPLRGRDGQYRWFLSRALPIRDERGRIVRWFGTNTDVTGQREAEEALRGSEARLRLATEAARLGIWDFHPLTGELSWDERTKAVFGLSPEAEVDYEVFLSGIHPEDRERVDGAIRRALDPSGSGAYETEYRTVGIEDGVARWVDAHGRAFFEGGRAVRFIGTVLDITDQKRAEEALRQSEERYRAVVEQTTEGIYLVDADTKRILEANPALQQMLGYTAGELRGMVLYDLIAHPREDVDANVRRTLELGRRLVGERRYRRKDGTPLDVDVGVNVISYGERRVICAVLRDVTERKRAEEALAEIRTAERNRIARELHDGVLQDLSYAAQSLEVTRIKAETTDLAEEIADEAETVRRAIRDLRESIYDLNLYRHGDQSVERLLRSLVELNRQRSPGCAIHLSLDENLFAGVSERIGMEILRIVQEALTNARRHSGARNVRVSLNRTDGNILAEVSDDGRGFDSDAPPGIGLRSMRERALDAGARLEIRSEPGRGTTVRVEIPTG